MSTQKVIYAILSLFMFLVLCYVASAGQQAKNILSFILPGNL